MKRNETINQLLKLYLQGKTTPVQEATLFAYLKDKHVSDTELNETMQDMWEQEPVERDDTESAHEELQAVWRKIARKQQRKVMTGRLLKYAASLLVFVSAGVMAYLVLKQSRPVAEPDRMMTKRTSMGEKVKLILPDSSVVYLAGNSKLTWSSRFVNGQPRLINLEGEAFFDVRHNKHSPFIVQSAGMRTQVLGTSFNVYAYPHDRVFSVAVRTGKVGVMACTKGRFSTLSLLTPGMKLVYYPGAKTYAVNEVPVADVNSWTTNRFVFRNETLPVMLNTLERYYNVKFHISSLPKLGSCRFNASFINKSIHDIMGQLKVMTGNKIKYKVNDDHTIIVWGEGC